MLLSKFYRSEREEAQISNLIQVYMQIKGILSLQLQFTVDLVLVLR